MPSAKDAPNKQSRWDSQARKQPGPSTTMPASTPPPPAASQGSRIPSILEAPVRGVHPPPGARPPWNAHRPPAFHGNRPPYNGPGPRVGPGPPHGPGPGSRPPYPHGKLVSCFFNKWSVHQVCYATMQLEI